MKYKKWTLDQELEILSSAEEIGIVESCRKYGVSTGIFFNRKKKYEQKGEAGLKVTYDIKTFAGVRFSRNLTFKQIDTRPCESVIIPKQCDDLFTDR